MIKTKVVAYCRFSSEGQREESIDAQVRAIKEYCEKNNFTLIKIYKDEAISGTSTRDRESFLQLIEDSKDKIFSYVIVHKFDRFARNSYDHAIAEKKLNDNGVKLLSVLEHLNDDPESKILKSVLIGMNEYYSANLSREVKKGLYENAFKAIHNGGKPPLGYDLDQNRQYIVNQKEAASVKLIFQLALDGLGYANIAKILNEKGYKNKLGREFKKSSIRDTLLNMKYVGTYYFGLKDEHGKFQKNPVIIENSHVPIISKEIFFKVQKKIKKHKKGPRISDKNTYFLTGFFRCGECGGPYSGGYRSKNRNGSISYGYQCRKRKNKENSCKNKPIRKDLIEKKVYSIMKENIFSDKNLNILIDSMYDIISSKHNSYEIIKLKKELELLENMLLNLLDKNLKGEILDSIFNEKNKELSTKIISIQEKISSTQNRKEVSRQDIQDYLMQLKKDFNKSLNMNVLESFLKEIIIFQDRIEIHIRKFPVDMAKLGGSGGNRTRVRN